MYGKFFSSTFTGSMYGAGPVVFAVWGFVIANCVDSTVELNPKMLAPMLGATENEVVSAVQYLCDPDPQSRNPSEEGRRLLKTGQFSYQVVTHSHYRAMRNEDDRREYNKLKMRESRSRRKSNSPICPPIPRTIIPKMVLVWIEKVQTLTKMVPKKVRKLEQMLSKMVWSTT